LQWLLLHTQKQIVQMKTLKLTIILIGLLILSSCTKEEIRTPRFFDYIKTEVYPTSINLTYDVSAYPGEYFEINYIKSGILVGEDSTKLSQKIYVSDTTDKKFHIDIKNLKTNTTYYIKIFLETKDEIVYGNKCHAITTSPSGVPVLDAKFLHNDSNYNALLSGIVISDGGAPIEECGFIVEGKTYKFENPSIQGDTLKFMLNDLNVPVRYIFYARNRYGVSNSREEYTSFNYHEMKYKNFEVKAINDTIEASCTFYGNGFSDQYIVVSKSPIVIPNGNRICPRDDQFKSLGWDWIWRFTNKPMPSGPLKFSYDWQWHFEPNTTLYVRMVVGDTYSSFSENYYWTEEKTITTP